MLLEVREALKNQIYLGNEVFVDDIQCKMAPGTTFSKVPASQKQRWLH